MSQCNVQTLLSNAACFECVSPGMWEILELQLLCEILNSSGGAKLKSFSQGSVAIPAATTVAVNHGLGALPNLFDVKMVCTVADGAFTPGDAIPLSDIITAVDANNGGGGNLDMGANATQIWVSCGPSFGNISNTIFTVNNVMVATPAGGATQTVTAGKWVFQFNALAF